MNIKGTEKSLNGIFNGTVELTPPAGSGECAAPKLLHYAFKHGLKPLAIAEFGGRAAKIRKSASISSFILPACENASLFLGHMLEGLVVDDNPLLTNPPKAKP